MAQFLYIESHTQTAIEYEPSILYNLIELDLCHFGMFYLIELPTQTSPGLVHCHSDHVIHIETNPVQKQ